jgi:glutamate-1-semialdehyde 2,1-aminomutase
MIKATKRQMYLWRSANRLFPGGVNSPVRAFKAVGGTPLFINQGKGSRIIDVDGREFIDYVLSWGPLILGHSHPEVVKAIRFSARRGASFGAPTRVENELADMIVKAIPSIEMLRFVNSGTEACMSAIRLARGFTRRDGVVKFEGCYHGHSDGLLVKAGSGGATFGVSSSKGVPKEISSLTYVLPYNDIDVFLAFCRRRWKKIACVIVEPVAGNMGVIPPREGFLEGLRKITERYGIVLIFDEVITGFRFCFGGVQNIFGINPDLTILGKIIGGGLPVGVYGGRREIMEMVSPCGPVYQAGTLSGNPIAMSAGLATLKVLKKELRVYERLDKITRILVCGFERLAKRAKISINRFGSMMTVFFTEGDVADFMDASRSDIKRYARFFHNMLECGVYLPPSQFEAMFVSTAHRSIDIEKTLKAGEEVLKRI